MWTVANCYVFFTVIYIICQIFECCLLCPWPAGCNDTAWKITWSRINRQKTRQTLQIDNRYYRSGQMTNISLQKCDFHNPFMPRGSFVGNVVRYHTHTACVRAASEHCLVFQLHWHDMTPEQVARNDWWWHEQSVRWGELSLAPADPSACKHVTSVAHITVNLSDLDEVPKRCCERRLLGETRFDSRFWGDREESRIAPVSCSWQLAEIWTC